MLAQALLLFALAAGSGEGPRPAQLGVDEALELAFPDCAIERVTVVLSEAEEERVEALAGHELASRLVRPYVALRAGRLVGTAYFDAHVVRTKKEVVMLVVTPEQRLGRVEVLSFAEPPAYLPRPAFYAQFVGRALDERLDVGRDIRGVAGATLSAEAATRAARRTLALHRVLAARAERALATR